MQRTVERIVASLLRPIARRVRLMVARGVVSLVTESAKMQGLQLSVLADEVQDDVERFQEYGFTSYPKAGAEALLLAVGANRDHLVAVAVDDRRTRPTDLAEGEVALYTADNAKRVHLKADGKVLLGTEPENFVALANLTKSQLDAIANAFNNHTHATGVGPSGPPVPTAMVSISAVAATEVKAK
jgi:phage baseplate assembly protein V